MNKIKYDRKSFEAELTDTLGKDVTETSGNIFVARQLALQNNTNDVVGNNSGQRFQEPDVEEMARLYIKKSLMIYKLEKIHIV